MSISSAEQPVVSVRQLPEAKLHAPRRWEVSYGSEAAGWTVIGWIDEKRLRGARNTFYFAIGIHPKTNKHYRLEGNTDFDERVNVIADFHRDPMTSRQHLGMDGR